MTGEPPAAATCRPGFRQLSHGRFGDLLVLGFLAHRVLLSAPVVATAGTNGSICGKPLGLTTALSSALIGLEAHPIRVEVCCTRGPAFFQMVGLAEAAVREARVRVASALARIGVLLDEYAITINLAPAELRKSGAALDVAIAVGVLEAIGDLPIGSSDGVLLLGELSLDGGLQPIRGRQGPRSLRR